MNKLIFLEASVFSVGEGNTNIEWKKIRKSTVVLD